MKLFNMEKKSEYNINPKVKKIRYISDAFFIIAIVVFLLTFVFWTDEYSEIEVNGIDAFFKPPILFIVIIVLCCIVGGILHFVAVGKSIISEVKNDDNLFLNNKND